jgi:hypothetical protein
VTPLTLPPADSSRRFVASAWHWPTRRSNAARQAAAKAAGDEFGARLRLAFEEMQWMLAERSKRDLHPCEVIVYMAAREHFNALVIAQQRFADAKLARLIDVPQET